MDAAPDALADTRPSSRLLKRRGRYTLIEKIAEGGMGAVYAAIRDGAVEPCVLKQLRPEINASAQAVRRFYREARVGARLLHPNIAQILGAGMEDGAFCISMELVGGLDLEAMHRAMVGARQLLPVELLVRVALDVLEGLDYAHRATSDEGEPLGLVHRDVTLKNVMVTFDGHTKLIDFGLVRGGGEGLTRPGAFLGTPRFASPEQALGAPIDARSDLYSLSVVLFECLSGTLLIRPGSVSEMLDAIRTSEVPNLWRLNPALPAALARAVERGLAKDREARYPSAAEYARALAEAAGPLAATTPADVGAFVRASFPAEARRLAELLARVAALVEERDGPDRSLGEQLRTRTVPRAEPLPEPPDADGTGIFVDFRSGPSAELASVLDAPLAPSMLTPIALPGGAPPPARRTPWLPMLLSAALASGLTALLLRPTGTIVLPREAPPAASPVPVVPAAVVAEPAPLASPSEAPVASRAPTAAPRPSRSPVASPTEPAPPPAPLQPAKSALAGLLEAYEAAPSDAARDALTRALEAHPRAAAIALDLALIKQAATHRAALERLRVAVRKLEP